MSDFKHQVIEKKWQNFWQQNEVNSVVVDKSKDKFYVLEMLPYPSGKLHMGHVRNYTIGDAFARFKKAQGFNVLHPMGWDSFGLPAENAAIENNTHPEKWTIENIGAMKKELNSLGFSYDWKREISTCLKTYYKHEQSIFIDLYNNNLAYQKESFVNWDPVDKTVLANEQVVNGRGWRSGALIETKKLRQWFLKISSFAEELLPSNSQMDAWPDAVKSIQEKWIGKSQGAQILFDIKNSSKKIEVFTTRPDTLFGASFIVISPHHPIIDEFPKNDKIIQFIDECNSLGTSEEVIEKADKKGIPLGIEVIHPFTKKSLPVFIANYVLMDYGTGAVFGCPAHDERDHEFAQKYNLPILPVVKNEDNWNYNLKPYIGDGIIFNSEFLNELNIGDAKKAATQKLVELNAGKRVTTFRLRDWGVSRQRYWGCPIPMIYCDSCGVVPVKKKDLPVELPKDVVFSGRGNPLDAHPTWKHVNCPECNKPAIRETDTFDTFFESSWYFLRYCSPESENFGNKTELDYWLPVDQYIGGIEHAAMHLLYARFFIKALKKCGMIAIEEPFKALLTQGMVLHATYKDNDGKWLYPEEAKNHEQVIIGRCEKMSKSKKNTISPIEIIAQFGADTARLFVLSDSPPEKDLEWTEKGVEGCHKFLNKLWKVACEVKNLSNIDKSINQKDFSEIRSKLHKLIKSLNENYQTLSFNVVVAGIREFSNILFSIERTSPNKEILDESLTMLVKLLFPICPHICEEIWELIGHHSSLSLGYDWPQADPNYLVSKVVTIAIQVSGKLRATLEAPVDSSQEDLFNLAIVNPNIGKFIAGNEIKKIILVPNKILNIVI